MVGSNCDVSMGVSAAWQKRILQLAKQRYGLRTPGMGDLLLSGCQTCPNGEACRKRSRAHKRHIRRDLAIFSKLVTVLCAHLLYHEPMRYPRVYTGPLVGLL